MFPLVAVSLRANVSCSVPARVPADRMVALSEMNRQISTSWLATALVSVPVTVAFVPDVARPSMRASVVVALSQAPRLVVGV